jgi:DNA-3-methyladenine glycosylase
LAEVKSLATSAFLLEDSFYNRNTVEVAQDLLGKILIVQSSPHEWTAGRIVETEAYRGSDPASHSSRGETPRCSVMFGNPGVAYVYLIYGMYEMLNFVTEPQGQPGAVLIRAVEPLWGIDLMEKRRKIQKRIHLTNGPGKLCSAMGIQMSHNAQSLKGPSLWVIDDGFRAQSYSQSGRVGIRLGKEVLWRFFLTQSDFVSRAPQNQESIRVDQG